MVFGGVGLENLARQDDERVRIEGMLQRGHLHKLGFGVWGLGFGVWGLGFRV